MHAIVLTTLITLSSLLVCQSTGAAPLFSPPEDDLVDSRYYEGFRDFANVSAGKPVLVSVTEGPGPRDSVEHPQFTLQFYVPPELEDNPIEIFVEDSRRSYYMMPVRHHWPSGHNTFAWNSSTASERGVGLCDLFGIATVKDAGPELTLLPLRFFASLDSLGLDNSVYDFVFIATRQALLRYTVYDDDLGEVHAGLLKDVPKNWPSVIRWHPRSAANGRYILEIKYQLKNGEILEGQSVYYFYHYDAHHADG